MSTSARNQSDGLRRDLAEAASGREGGARQPLRLHRGIVAPLRRNHVDTDQIIPKQFLKRIERTGFGPFLFSDWKRDPSFVLNQPRYAGASVLVAGVNFGCGSSREHAAWALLDAGFQVVIASSFADIFRSNAIGNGMLPVVLPEAAVETIMSRAEQQADYAVEVDLERSEVRDGLGLKEPFTIDAASRQRLLEGTDEIDLILKNEPDIAAYERRRFDALA
ncbi:MAG TPA: 3-isopropylmalate dehydratase small subunit [Vicinamibacterales bacterium]|nr:3-isopropylmalate dehydratase small subunit [Vicinamibacterales bacterium]